jgi:pSer/pThr/pTyr-binding forkhead associated (FHA) protein
MHTLTLVEGPGAPQSFVLEHRVTMVGRGVGNDIVLDGPKVSKRHVLLTIRSDDTLFLEDLNSRNGVFVDDRRVAETPLRSGSTLRVGECRLRYELMDSRVSDIIPRKASKVDTGYKLLIADREGAIEEIPLLSECVYLGKAEENDVVLPGPDVSRRHAMLCFENGGWQIHDLESTNGTAVQGRNVSQAAVEPGARIRIGRFLVVIEGPGHAVAREELEAEAARELQRSGGYLAWSTQIVLLVLLLALSAGLVAVVLFKVLRR